MTDQRPVRQRLRARDYSVFRKNYSRSNGGLASAPAADDMEGRPSKNATVLLKAL